MKGSQRACWIRTGPPSAARGRSARPRPGCCATSSTGSAARGRHPPLPYASARRSQSSSATMKASMRAPVISRIALSARRGNGATHATARRSPSLLRSKGTTPSARTVWRDSPPGPDATRLGSRLTQVARASLGGEGPQQFLTRRPGPSPQLGAETPAGVPLIAQGDVEHVRLDRRPATPAAARDATWAAAPTAGRAHPPTPASARCAPSGTRSSRTSSSPRWTPKRPRLTRLSGRHRPHSVRAHRAIDPPPWGLRGLLRPSMRCFRCSARCSRSDTSPSDRPSAAAISATDRPRRAAAASRGTFTRGVALAARRVRHALDLRGHRPEARLRGLGQQRQGIAQMANSRFGPLQRAGHAQVSPEQADLDDEQQTGRSGRSPLARS